MHETFGSTRPNELTNQNLIKVSKNIKLFNKKTLGTSVINSNIQVKLTYEYTIKLPAGGKEFKQPIRLLKIGYIR